MHRPASHSHGTDTASAPTGAPVNPQQFTTFAQFYPYYLREHSHRMCRRMHFIGSSLALLSLLALLATGNAWFLLAALLSGYGFAWLGHFVFEKNRPASFQRPLYSFRGDWVMYRQMCCGELTF